MITYTSRSAGPWLAIVYYERRDTPQEYAHHCEVVCDTMAEALNKLTEMYLALPSDLYGEEFERKGRVRSGVYS